VFIPIRSLQILAILTQETINFVDSQAYAVFAEQGGRLIILAWNIPNAATRQQLDAPVMIDVLEYRAGLEVIQRRLIREFQQAMRLCWQRQHHRNMPSATVVDLMETQRKESV
jgi:hypothetical protein